MEYPYINKINRTINDTKDRFIVRLPIAPNEENLIERNRRYVEKWLAEREYYALERRFLPETDARREAAGQAPRVESSITPMHLEGGLYDVRTLIQSKLHHML